MVAVKWNHLDCVELLLADTRVDLMTRDKYEKSEEEVVRYVEDLKRPVLEVLEECIRDERRELFKLGKIWGTGDKVNSIKFKILEELEGYWRKLARQGRSLEEAARARGHPELATLVEAERQRRGIELFHFDEG